MHVHVCVWVLETFCNDVRNMLKSLVCWELQVKWARKAIFHLLRKRCLQSLPGKFFHVGCVIIIMINFACWMLDVWSAYETLYRF